MSAKSVCETKRNGHVLRIGLCENVHAWDFARHVPSNPNLRCAQGDCAVDVEARVRLDLLRISNAPEKRIACESKQCSAQEPNQESEGHGHTAAWSHWFLRGRGRVD